MAATLIALEGDHLQVCDDTLKSWKIADSSSPSSLFSFCEGRMVWSHDLINNALNIPSQ